MTLHKGAEPYKRKYLQTQYQEIPDRRYGFQEKPLEQQAVQGLGMKYIEAILSASTQSIPDAAWTALTVYTRKTNYPKMLGSGSISIKDTGYYVITATINFAYNATGYRAMRLTTTGGLHPGQIAYSPSLPIASIDTTFSLSWCGFLQNGQTVALEVYQNSGGALNIKDSSHAVTYITVAEIFKKV